ncbi:hypothetical protein J6590_023693 [Homalodisca vitripennis]|nr:hypothetical protein J6590_023693 [Homalodisca vitripennis]
MRKLVGNKKTFSDGYAPATTRHDVVVCNPRLLQGQGRSYSSTSPASGAGNGVHEAIGARQSWGRPTGTRSLDAVTIGSRVHCYSHFSVVPKTLCHHQNRKQFEHRVEIQLGPITVKTGFDTVNATGLRVKRGPGGVINRVRGPVTSRANTGRHLANYTRSCPRDSPVPRWSGVTRNSGRWPRAVSPYIVFLPCRVGVSFQLCKASKPA